MIKTLSQKRKVKKKKKKTPFHVSVASKTFFEIRMK